MTLIIFVKFDQFPNHRTRLLKITREDFTRFYPNSMQNILLRQDLLCFFADIQFYCDFPSYFFPCELLMLFPSAVQFVTCFKNSRRFSSTKTDRQKNLHPRTSNLNKLF